MSEKFDPQKEAETIARLVQDALNVDNPLAGTWDAVRPLACEVWGLPKSNLKVTMNYLRNHPEYPHFQEHEAHSGLLHLVTPGSPGIFVDQHDWRKPQCANPAESKLVHP